MTDVYKQLAVHLDNLPAGFPETDTGVELKILKHIFTPREAEIACKLTMMPEPVSAIATRLGLDEKEAGEVLQDMSSKGLIFRMAKGGEKKFMAAQFVVGIWEYQLNRLSSELIDDFNEYSATFMTEAWRATRTKQLRVVPVTQSITAEMKTMAYDEAKAIIKSQSKIVVSDCICRKEHKISGKGCDYPMEVCLAFGTGAWYYEENGLGRSVGQDEALEILEKGMDAGLVLQPGNSKKPSNICMCCSCCCQILKNMKNMENPGELVHSNFYAQVDEENCTGCGVCADRCHMDAIVLEEIASVKPERCIGCGVCVPSCEFDALGLIEKAADDHTVPPENIFETFVNIAQERGKL